MSLVDWSDEYSVKVYAMDSHHKMLFDIINRMHESMKAGMEEIVIGAHINELIEYARYHFSEEERLMEKINYPGLEAHRRAHRAFAEKLEEFKKEVDDGMAVFTAPKLARTGIEWLKEHILVMDKQYGGPANTAGIR